MSNAPSICLKCRIANKGWSKCGNCGRDMIEMPKQWNAPKQRNKKAWKRIEQGKIYWDRRRADKGSGYGWGKTLYAKYNSKGHGFGRTYERSTYEDYAYKYFLEQIQEYKEKYDR